MQRLHCQPAGVSANRWGNAGAGTPKLALPWKRFASWSPAISLQLFSFHDRSTRAWPNDSGVWSVTIVSSQNIIRCFYLTTFLQHFVYRIANKSWWFEDTVRVFGFNNTQFWTAHKELLSMSPVSYFSLMSLDVMSWPCLCLYYHLYKAYLWLSLCIVEAQNAGLEKATPSHHFWPCFGQLDFILWLYQPEKCKFPPWDKAQQCGPSAADFFFILFFAAQLIVLLQLTLELFKCSEQCKHFRWIHYIISQWGCWTSSCADCLHSQVTGWKY